MRRSVEESLNIPGEQFVMPGLIEGVISSNDNRSRPSSVVGSPLGLEAELDVKLEEALFDNVFGPSHC